MKRIIQKGQKYRTRSEDNFHAKTNLIVTKVTGQSDDDFVFWKAETPIKYKRRYNKGNCRVWWIREYCFFVDNTLSTEREQ